MRNFRGYWKLPGSAGYSHLAKGGPEYSKSRNPRATPIQGYHTGPLYQVPYPRVCFCGLDVCPGNLYLTKFPGSLSMVQDCILKKKKKRWRDGVCIILKLANHTFDFLNKNLFFSVPSILCQFVEACRCLSEQNMTLKCIKQSTQDYRSSQLY